MLRWALRFNRAGHECLTSRLSSKRSLSRRVEVPSSVPWQQGCEMTQKQCEARRGGRSTAAIDRWISLSAFTGGRGGRLWDSVGTRTVGKRRFFPPPESNWTCQTVKPKFPLKSSSSRRIMGGGENPAWKWLTGVSAPPSSNHTADGVWRRWTQRYSLLPTSGPKTTETQNALKLFKSNFVYKTRHVHTQYINRFNTYYTLYYW